jgi:hypothetical protein
MQKFSEFIPEGIRKLNINVRPGSYKKGWWLDKDVITFFHGTHEKNLEFIEKNGIIAPTDGPTANWVSLALEPFTGHGYASMSGSGGESGFRKAGTKAVHVPDKERITFVIKMPKKTVLAKMADARGNMDKLRNRLSDKEEYDNLVTNGRMADSEYYALTEIRFPKKVSPKYIKGYTYLKGK